MKTYQFRLVLKGSVELTEELAERLFASGCDDATPGLSNGVFIIDFHRQAGSLEEAIRLAMKDVRHAGCEVEHVEIEAGAMAQTA